MTAPRRPTKLYWCTTSDHDEDWFILAWSERSARKLHADAEGYDTRGVSAELVADLPASIDEPAGWPSHEAIEACGGRFLAFDAHATKEAKDLAKRLGHGGRIVQFGDRVYVEGAMQPRPLSDAEKAERSERQRQALAAYLEACVLGKEGGKA